MIRHDAKLRQLESAFSASSFVTPAELARLRALTRQQREIAWLTIPAAKLAAEATPDYVEVSLAQLATKVHVDDAQLKTYYDEQKAKTPERFTQAEQRRVRHILFQVADPKDDAAAKAKAEAALKRAQSGEDFGKLAQELSQDSGSAKNGGDLGWAERSRYVGPFADAAFSMKEGEIKGPIKTQFGYHILKLDGIQPVAVKSFEQSKSDMDAEYRRTEAEKLFNDAQDSLADAALQNGDIDVVARKAGLEVHDLANFSRTGGGGDLGKSPAVVEAAFSPDVLDGHLSPMVEIEKGRGVVLRATDHQAPKQKPLEEVRTDVIAAWKKERGSELATEQAVAAVKRLQGGESWDSVAKSLGLTAQPPKFVARADQTVPAEIRQGVFDEPKPAGKPVYSSAPLPDGDAAVIALSAVREEPASGDSTIQEAMLKRQLMQQAAAAEAREYSAAARADAKVSENLQALD
jgi:peptidyl-prolyl cis-trans isomerase D